MVTEGYLLRAIGQDKYFDLNLCLVASLRFHGDKRPISIFTDNPEHEIFKRYPALWDQIIDIRPLVEDLKVKFNRDFKMGNELGALGVRLLIPNSPYDRIISVDGDCCGGDGDPNIAEAAGAPNPVNGLPKRPPAAG